MNELHDLLDESEDLVSELGFVDRSALAYMVAAQTLANALPSRESVPLLSEIEHGVLRDRVRAIADDLREAAGTRGIDLWKKAQ